MDIKDNVFDYVFEEDNHSGIVESFFFCQDSVDFMDSAIIAGNNADHIHLDAIVTESIMSDSGMTDSLAGVNESGDDLFDMEQIFINSAFSDNS